MKNEIIQYEAKFSIRLRSVVDAVKDFEDSINQTFKEFGLNEKLITESEIGSIEIQVDRELSDEEQYKMRALLESEMVQKFPKYDVRLNSFGRKSGNVQQSVSQEVL